MILVGIGANLAGRDGRTPLETCRWAVSRLDRLPGLRVRGLSRWFESAPVPPSGQPSFVNAIVHLRAEAPQAPDPALVLTWLMQVEQDAGRERSVPNAARTLDLDLIAYDRLILDTPDLVLPHPRAHQRAFVLRPLNDVAPDWMHPLFGVPVATLIEALPPQTLRILEA